MVRSKKIQPKINVVIDDSVKEAIKEGLERHREQITDLLADIVLKDYLEHQTPTPAHDGPARRVAGCSRAH